MKLRYAPYLMIVSVVCCVKTGHTQPGVNLQIYKAINTQVQQILGSAYEAGSIMNVDSSLTPDEVEDPYGTLKHCYIFFAGDEDWSLIGIFKDGQIIWHSDTLIGGIDFDGVNFYATRDINHDGKVDIITSWYAGGRFGIEYLWVFGWDGHTGVLENAVDDQGQSVIVAEQGTFEFLDIKGDGVMDIVGRQDSVQFVDETDNGITQKIRQTIEKRYVVYSWNGQLYGRWPDTPPYPVNGIVPRNKVDVDVRASVTQTSTGLEYRYIIHSEPTSKQGIDQIVLAPVSDSLQGISARLGWGFNPVGGNLLWTDDNFIGPGETDSSFVYQTRAFPIICNYYVRGHNGPIMGPGGPAWYNDVLTNSVHGLTIAAGDPPSPFVSLSFLDTLISYKHQCVTLGWLTNGPEHEKDEDGDKADEGIVERLDRRLDKAKAALSKTDSVKAGLELELFVKEVEHIYYQNKKEGKRRGVPVLTSEGYALLKYNAEYLIDRLPEKHGRGDEGERRGKK